jgi:hypothetical protein
VRAVKVIVVSLAQYIQDLRSKFYFLRKVEEEAGSRS